MPRRSLFTATERELLLAFPDDETDIIRYYTFSEQDLSLIRQHRGAHNRLGFSIQLCYLRYPGHSLPVDGEPPPFLLQTVSQQLKIDSAIWPQYAERAETRREHLLELQTVYGFNPFSGTHYQNHVKLLTDLALQTDKGIILAKALVEDLRKNQIIIPALNVIERICTEAITRGTRRIYQTLAGALTEEQCDLLDKLLEVRTPTKSSGLAWLRQPAGAPNAKHLLEHIDRLKSIYSLNLDEGLEYQIHQNRLLKLAREGRQMTAQHLRDLEPSRRYATIVAILLETRATIIDEIVDMHDRIMGTLFSRAKRSHAEQFQQSGKAVNDKVRLFWRIGQALLEVKQSGKDPFVAIESILSWEAFTQSITEAEKLAQSVKSDFLSGIGNGYTQIRRYAPALLETLHFSAAPAAKDILDAITALKLMNAEKTHKVPKPTTGVSVSYRPFP